MVVAGAELASEIRRSTNFGLLKWKPEALKRTQLEFPCDVEVMDVAVTFPFTTATRILDGETDCPHRQSAIFLDIKKE